MVIIILLITFLIFNYTHIKRMSWVLFISAAVFSLALKMALEMSKAERINRYQQLIEGLSASDLTHWRNDFLDDLEKTPTLLMKPQRLLQDNYQSIYQVL